MSAGPPIALRAVTAGDVEFLRALFVDTRRPEFASLNWPAPLLEKLLHTQFDLPRRDYATAYPTVSAL